MLWQPLLETIPPWFYVCPGRKCILCTQLSTIVWSANDSSQRALTHSDLRVYVSPERRQLRMLGLFDVSCHEMWTDVFPCLSTLIQVCVWNLLIGYRCSCLVRHSVHHLSAQLSICLIFVDLFTLEGISDCTCFQWWATMQQLETMIVRLHNPISRTIRNQAVVWVALERKRINCSVKCWVA